MNAKSVFITGGTGYIGSRLIPRLLARGHSIKALVRHGSEKKLPPGCEQIPGDPLKRESFTKQIQPAETFIQLVGVAHPSPAKANQFRMIDLVSVQESVAAAVQSNIRHFIYLSVAQPAPVMKIYQEVRRTGEKLIRDANLNSTILRPWYVLGPGHRWPYLLLPAYWILERLPSTRESARRLGMVTLDEMLNALVYAVENPVTGIQVVDVPAIRQIGRS